jgi:hypothetical protein
MNTGIPGHEHGWSPGLAVYAAWHRVERDDEDVGKGLRDLVCVATLVSV